MGGPSLVGWAEERSDEPHHPQGNGGTRKTTLGPPYKLEVPTSAMKSEAATAGMYQSPWDQKNYPRVQILTIEELLSDPYRPNPRCLSIPGGSSSQHTLPEAPKHKGKGDKQMGLGF